MGRFNLVPSVGPANLTQHWQSGSARLAEQ